MKRSVFVSIPFRFFLMVHSVLSLGNTFRTIRNRSCILSKAAFRSSRSCLALLPNDRQRVYLHSPNEPSLHHHGILGLTSLFTKGAENGDDSKKKNETSSSSSNGRKRPPWRNEYTQKGFSPFFRRRQPSRSKIRKKADNALERNSEKHDSNDVPGNTLPVPRASKRRANEPRNPKKRKQQQNKRDLHKGDKQTRTTVWKRVVKWTSVALAVWMITPLREISLQQLRQPAAVYHESPFPTASLEKQQQEVHREIRVEDSGTESSAARSINDVAPISQGVLEDIQNSRQNKMPLGERRAMALSFVTEAVDQIAPTVVRIDTETHSDDDTVLPVPTTPRLIHQGQGSGVIIRRDGLILTNAHVIEDATRVTVTLTDGRVYEARVCGADEIVDIAVLQITARENLNDLAVARLGDSDTLRVGRIVVAVGSAGGLDGSVTMGIVSGLERSSAVVGIPHKKVDYIQTDAAINPGNSGGPLVDVETCEVIGINAAIRAHMEGTSFSIPINRVREIMDDLAAGKDIQHGYLGVSLATCTPEWAKRSNSRAAANAKRIPEVQGALVHKVFPHTPAEKGGLRGGDIILEINGELIQNSDQARRLIDRSSIGKNLVLSILRDKQQIELSVSPVDLATRLKEMRQERQQQMHQERLRFLELGPFHGVER